MKITKKKIEWFSQFYYQLMEYADRWTSTFPGRHGTVRITQDGLVEEEINTSCHCHPEYEWVARGNLNDLLEWIEKQNS